MNVTDPLRAFARERPSAHAVLRVRGAPLSWRELDALVDAVARRCLDDGIAPGDVVHVAIQRPFRTLVLSLALARLGAAAAAATLPWRVAKHAYVDQPGVADAHPDARVVEARWFEPPSSPPDPVPAHADPRAIAIVCPSSGTTGIPKAIPVSHAQLAARIAAANAGVPLPAEPRQICAPTPASGYGFLSMLRVLHAGGTIVVATTPEEIVALATSKRVNRLVLMPFWIDQLATALPRGTRLSVGDVEVGGAFLPAPLLRIARERLGERIHSVYGATEAGCIAMAGFDTLDSERGEVGRVLPGIEVEAFDDHGRALPRGEEGELRLRGPMCADRYLDDARATAEGFRDGWLVTPDLGRVAPDGTLAIVGRRGELINLGGYRVRPSAVEEALLSIDAIEDAGAFGAPDASGATRLCAAVVVRGPLDAASLEALVLARLGAGAPTFVMRVGAVPRNAGGKIMRDTLAAMAREAGLGSG